MKGIDSDLPHARQRPLHRNPAQRSSTKPQGAGQETERQEHQLIERVVHDEYPVLIEYRVTAYAYSPKKVMTELHAWGMVHRRKLFGKQQTPG